MCSTTIVHLTNRAPTVVRLTSVNLDADIRKYLGGLHDRWRTETPMIQNSHP